MNYETANAHLFDIEELACKILGLDYDKIDGDSSIIENEIFDEFNIDMDIFREIINRLLPLIDVGHNPITNTNYKGFSDLASCWLVKIEIPKNKSKK